MELDISNWLVWIFCLINGVVTVLDEGKGVDTNNYVGYDDYEYMICNEGSNEVGTVNNDDLGNNEDGDDTTN